MKINISKVVRRGIKSQNQKGEYMRIRFLAILIFMFNIGIAGAEERIIYDFQKYIGEGEYDLYRVEVDFSKQSGELCFLRTAWSNMPSEVSLKLSKNMIWSKYVDIKKYKPACFTFTIYDPFGWFYSQPFNYGDHEYRFFFVGNLNKKSMKGKIYQFIDHNEGDKHYRLIDDVDVFAKAL